MDLIRAVAKALFFDFPEPDARKIALSDYSTRDFNSSLKEVLCHSTLEFSRNEVSAIIELANDRCHGDETPADCLALKERGYAVLKAIAVTADVDWEAYRAYEDAVEMFVLDSKSAGRGGSGRKFDWAVLRGYPLSTPYLLGGGVSADDGALLAGYSLPGMAGVDLNSRFELSPGHKDVSLLTPFIVSLRKSYENE